MSNTDNTNNVVTDAIFKLNDEPLAYVLSVHIQNKTIDGDFLARLYFGDTEFVADWTHEMGLFQRYGRHNVLTTYAKLFLEDTLTYEDELFFT
jgi:hypothetical protein